LGGGSLLLGSCFAWALSLFIASRNSLELELKAQGRYVFLESGDSHVVPRLEATHDGGGSSHKRCYLRLRLACSAATLGHLTSEAETGLRIRDQRGEAALARVAVSNVAFEVVD